MTKYEKEILQKQIEIEEYAFSDLKKVFENSNRNLQKNIRLLAVSDIMDELNRKEAEWEIPGSSKYAVYQQKYQEEIRNAVKEPITELENDVKKIFNKSVFEWFLLGYIGTVFLFHKSGIPVFLNVPNSTSSDNVSFTVKVIFGEPQVAEWYQYIRKDVNDLFVRTVSDITRHIANGESYNNIARAYAKSMKNTPYNQAMNKALRTVRTEGGRVQNQAAFEAMKHSKDKGADVVKQWDATLDTRTRPSHAKVDGEIRELDERFSNGLLYPHDPNGSAAEVINCRCALLPRAKCALDETELQTLKDRAEYFGLDKTENYDDFKKKYLNTI